MVEHRGMSHFLLQLVYSCLWMVNSISNCLIDYKKQRNNKQTVCHILVQHVIKVSFTARTVPIHVYTNTGYSNQVWFCDYI